MDLQIANSAAVRSVDDLPGAGAPFWGNMAWQFETMVHQPYRSMPLEAVVALAMETDTALWASVPITLGNPDDFFSDEFRNVEATDQWAGAYRAKTRENIDPVLDSPEWDRYADRFVSALIAQGYPEDRTLYVTVANEVWNFAWQYFHTTQYAWGVGEALKDRLKMSDGNYRQGYGVITARWKLAFDAALERAGRKQKVIYVVESQAAWADTTSWALEGVKSWLDYKGERWEDHAGAFGVSIASYWGDEGAYADARQTRDPVEFNRLLQNALINGHPKSNFSRPNVVKLFRDHAAKAKAYGVPVIGAYEGGSHLERPKDVSEELYKGFMWGDGGAAVNRAVNDALAKEFPGIILSNYVLAGPPGGQPWFEGFYGATNPYALSWDAYLRPAPAAKDAPGEE
jgi:ABC-type sugar transport system substrate-binding protein